MKRNVINTQILVVGGGVSGASLAIRLARQNLNVLLIEKERFPRQKLCGEFVSPECLAHFDSLGVLDSVRDVRGDVIRKTRFYSESGRSVSVPSEWFFNGENGALGISRAEMDFRLLEKARQIGVKVLEENSVVGLVTNGRFIEGISTKNARGEIGKIKANLFVDATGRSRILGKLLEKSNRGKVQKGKIKHVAFKTHLENVELEKGTCEIYIFRGGYGGLNYVENGAANHCFLVDSRIAREFKGNADRIVSEVILKNHRARKTMKSARKKFDWLAVSVEKFGWQPANDIKNLISIGDASAFIDPFTGSGMLMALESSELLAHVFRIGSRFVEDPQRVKDEFEKSHKYAVKRRIRTCAVIHHMSFSPRFAGFVISAVGANQRFTQKLASLTRPIIDTRSNA